METLDTIKAAAAEATETIRLKPQVDNITSMFRNEQPKPPAPSFEAELDRLYSLLTFDDQDRPLLAPRWRVRDTVALGGIVFIGGQSGAGKSYVVMDLARCLMTGEDFFGRNVDHPCAVVLFAPEGRETIDARLAAMKRHYGIKGNLPFAYLGELPDIDKPEGEALVVALLKRADAHFREEFDLPLGALFMDTLAATFNIEDQNDNSEAAKKIKAIKRIITAVNPDLTGIASHHYGKTMESGLSGAHGWRANADQVLSVLTERTEITGDTGIRELALAKNRNGSEGPIAPFSLEYVGLGYREDGTEWGNLYLVPQLDRPSVWATRKAPKAPPKHVRTFDEAVTEALIASGSPFTLRGHGPTVQAVPLVPNVREAFYARYPVAEADPGDSPEVVAGKQTEAKKKAFQRALKELGTKYGTETRGNVEWIWSVSR